MIRRNVLTLFTFLMWISFSCYGQLNDKTRALYIMDISRYVEWPPEALKDKDEFIIAILSNDDRLYWELENLAKSRKTIQSKAVRILLFREIMQIENSHVLYFNSEEDFDIERIINRTRGEHTLLITEGYEFRQSMINFVDIEGELRFEVNEELLNEEGMEVDQLFLAQSVKTREDWEELFKITEGELTEEKEITGKQREIIDKQKKEIEEQLDLISLQEKRLDSLDLEIKAKQNNINLQEMVLGDQEREIRTQKTLIETQAAQAEMIDSLIKKQTITITERDKTIAENEVKIDEQESRIWIQEKQIEKQKLISYFISVALVLLLGLAYFIYLNYRNKKRANIALEEKNRLILLQSEELRKQRDIAQNQRDQIAYQKNHITDSIQYAKKIQVALLPAMELFSDKLEHFVLYMPRDIVSGDFYWVNKIENRFIIITADCTGHGVPGAFMSMLGISLLNEIVGNKGIYHPDEILNALRENIIESLKQTNTDNKVKDGMDMTVCTIDTEKNILEFSGANNPLYLISGGKMLQIKGDKMPVAIHEKMDKFTLHKMKIGKGDCIYTFSDGYVDQFGGPKQKKFLSKKFRETLMEIYPKPMIEQANELSRIFEEWKGDIEQVDDVTVIGIRY